MNTIVSYLQEKKEKFAQLWENKPIIKKSIKSRHEAFEFNHFISSFFFSFFCSALFLEYYSFHLSSIFLKLGLFLGGLAFFYFSFFNMLHWLFPLKNEKLEQEQIDNTREIQQILNVIFSEQFLKDFIIFLNSQEGLDFFDITQSKAQEVSLSLHSAAQSHELEEQGKTIEDVFSILKLKEQQVFCTEKLSQLEAFIAQPIVEKHKQHLYYQK